MFLPRTLRVAKGDILDLLTKQRAVLNSALERLKGFNSSATLLLRDVDEADRLRDLIERRALDLTESTRRLPCKEGR